MKRFAIVSTYPKYGSKNIGDQLITNSLIMAIKDNFHDAEFDIVWRAGRWEDVKESIVNANHVFFCMPCFTAQYA